MFGRRFLLVLLPLLAMGEAMAQDDSLAIYRKIERIAEKHRATRWLYDAVFIPPRTGPDPAPASKDERRTNPYIKYNGRIIRHLSVRVFDPFGYTVEDTTWKPTSWLQRAGNSIHRTTRAFVIRNLLLIEPGDTLDPLKVTESERLVRGTPYVSDAKIIVSRVWNTKDSVDVLVLVHNKFSIDINAQVDASSVSLALIDRNFLGFGQELEQGFAYHADVPQLALHGHHSIYNIDRSYITSNLFYSTSAEQDIVGASLDRPFFSPLTRWAGGSLVSTSWRRAYYVGPITAITSDHAVHPFTFDTWLGRSFPLGDGKTMASQSSSIIIAARYAQTRYIERPPFTADTARVFSNTSLLLVSCGLSIRQYYKDRYLLRFGIAEDVPEGLLFTLTTGARKREGETNSPYVGAEISHGRNTDHLGYFSISLAYGTYFQHGLAEDGTLRSGLTYFTELATLGRWHLRQFVRISSVFGYGKPTYSHLALGGDELLGLTGTTLTGTHKSILSLETVAYAPYAILGFRFAPIMRIAFGNVGEQSDPLLSGRIFSAFSVGLLIRNENLLVKTFELSIGFYPYMPDGGSNFRANPFNSLELRTRDFAFGRPSEVAFQ